VHELDRDVVRVRPRLRRAAGGDQAAAADEAPRELEAQARDPVGLGGEERVARGAPPFDELVEARFRRC
jgi:hypothetical protein